MLLVLYMRRLWNDQCLITRFDEKEALELKNIYNHYFDKRSDFMNNSQFEIEDIFGDILEKDINSQD